MPRRRGPATVPGPLNNVRVIVIAGSKSEGTPMEMRLMALGADVRTEVTPDLTHAVVLSKPDRGLLGKMLRQQSDLGAMVGKKYHIVTADWVSACETGDDFTKVAEDSFDYALQGRGDDGSDPPQKKRRKKCAPPGKGSAPPGKGSTKAKGGLGAVLGKGGERAEPPTPGSADEEPSRAPAPARAQGESGGKRRRQQQQESDEEDDTPLGEGAAGGGPRAGAARRVMENDDDVNRVAAAAPGEPTPRIGDLLLAACSEASLTAALREALAPLLAGEPLTAPADIRRTVRLGPEPFAAALTAVSSAPSPLSPADVLAPWRAAGADVGAARPLVGYGDRRAASRSLARLWWLRGVGALQLRLQERAREEAARRGNSAPIPVPPAGIAFGEVGEDAAAEVAVRYAEHSFARSAPPPCASGAARRFRWEPDIAAAAAVRVQQDSRRYTRWAEAVVETARAAGTLPPQLVHGWSAEPELLGPLHECVRRQCLLMWLALRPCDALRAVAEGPVGGLCPYHAVHADAVRLWADPGEAVGSLQDECAEAEERPRAELALLLCTACVPADHPLVTRDVCPSVELARLQRDDIDAEFDRSEGQRRRLAAAEKMLERALAREQQPPADSEDPFERPSGEPLSAAPAQWVDVPAHAVLPHSVLWVRIAWARPPR
eukprot:TRINITY_DN14920_c0_g1_i1.p1 TRINITY_DN14920_c0_g1~~TRINITY_DN14920_c0_g1_i1.p1  ORF type:complete len:662 (+),score=171.94 TRINITY_DN14920_c0_g1_i1:86-2071(+)